MEKPEPKDYQQIFENNKVGAWIYEDLVSRFAGCSRGSEGIDRILDTFEAQGARKVIEFITLRINQGNGVKGYEPSGIDTDN